MQASRKIRDGAASGACKRGGGLVVDRLLDGAGTDVPKLSDEIVAFVLARFAEKARVRYAYEATASEFPYAGITEAQVKAVAKVHDIQMERGPEAGSAKAGRPRGVKNASGRLSKAEAIRQLRADHPDASLDWIGQQFEPHISRQAVAKHLKALGLK